MATEPEVDTATETALALGGAPWIVGTSVFYGLVRAPDPPNVPHKSIFVVPVVSQEPHRVMGPTSNNDIKLARLTIYVRGDSGETDVARSLAFQVLRLLDRRTFVTNAASYLWCLAKESSPKMNGLDKTNHPVYVFDLEVGYVG